MPPDQQTAISHRVVRWFQKNARDLPWRRTRDPYAIWISEVMLQQTQVKTVIPYWNRWMALFPDVLALAKAEEEAVLKAWEGLGYYSRARNLQKAARIVRDQHAGQFPAAYDQVLNLPGIGRYTAGAICSIAFGQAKPILDGNVARVLSRIFTVSGSIKAREIQEALWKLSAQLVALAGNSSALNQGLMELGATLCVPRAPLCPKCPVRKACAAFQTDRVPEFPARTGGPRFRKREFIAFILQRDGQVLLRRRSVEVVNGGLWEFPNLEIRPNGKK
ncbi:MAG TPA: A/G-specific adenine glycosylase, partial [Verrucomicrobiae bacterium]|nr:A/G-specific adenine glycosylase [Verrucomicrobiae bacterium]